MKTMETDGLLALPISVAFLRPKEYNIEKIPCKALKLIPLPSMALKNANFILWS